MSAQHADVKEQVGTGTMALPITPMTPYTAPVQDGSAEPRDERDTPRREFTDDEIALLRRTIFSGGTDDELRLFLRVCSRTGLDPFTKQIHAVKRRVYRNGRYEDAVTFQVGIDGFRLIAQRTGEYRGQKPIEWCGADGLWKEMWLSKDPPAAARAAVWRRGFVEPVYAVAHYREYVQTTREGKPNQMWEGMPANQLAKCAEALALRKAFPQELSGLYTDDEMGQADSRATAGTTAPPGAAPRNKPVEPGDLAFPYGKHTKDLPLDDARIPLPMLANLAEWILADAERTRRYAPYVEAISTVLQQRIPTADDAALAKLDGWLHHPKYPTREQDNPALAALLEQAVRARAEASDDTDDDETAAADARDLAADAAGELGDAGDV